MFEYACPKCRKKNRATTVQSGTVTSCPGCSQRLRMVLDIDDVGAPPASADGSAAATAPRSWASPWLVGACGAAGLGVSAVILLAWGFLRHADNKAVDSPPGPQASVQAAPALQPLSTTAPAATGKGKEEPKKEEPKKEEQGKHGTNTPEPPKPPESAGVQQLCQELRSPDAAVRKRAVARLGNLGAEARRAVPDLLALLRKPGETREVREAVLAALGEIGPATVDDLSALTDALADDSAPQARLYAADALERLGPQARAAVPALVKSLKDPATDVRRHAAMALARIGPEAREPARAALFEALKDPDRDVRMAAGDALRAQGKPVTADAGTLKAILADHSGPREARLFAVAALGELGPEFALALGSAVNADPDPEVRRAASEALANMKATPNQPGAVLTTGTPPPLTKALTPLALGRMQEGFLAEGPLPIRVGRLVVDKLTEDKGNLLLLTRHKLAYVPDKSTSISVREAADKVVQWVATQDGQYRWDLARDQAEFTGKVVPPPAIDLQPLPLTRDQEGHYLFVSLERLQEYVEEAVDQHDEGLMRACRRRAEALAASAREHRLNVALAELAEGVGPYLDAQVKTWEERRQIIREEQQKMEGLKRKEAEARSRRQVHQLLGFTQAFVGAVPQTVGYGVDSYGRGYELQTVDNEAVFSGLGVMMKGNLRYAAEQAQIDTAKKAYTGAAAGKFRDLQEQYAQRRTARAETFRVVGAKFGLSRSNAQALQEQIAERCRQGKDFSALVELVNERLRQERAAGQRDDPFLLVEMCRMRSQVPHADPKKRVGEMFDLARECVASARLLPAAAVYDDDRADILRTAAGFALTAATLEIGDQSWADAYNPKARFAVRLIGQAGLVGSFDVNGETREILAWALMQGGQLDDALQQALEIQELRKRSPIFLFRLARLYGARKDVKQALSCLEAAIRGGLSDIHGVRRCPELSLLLKDKAFLGLTRMTVESSVHFAGGRLSPGANTGHTIEVINRSPFALTNVKLRLEVAVANGKPQLFSDAPEGVIRPNETYTWSNAFSIEPRLGPRGYLMVECDQGKVKVAPVSR